MFESDGNTRQTLFIEPRGGLAERFCDNLGNKFDLGLVDETKTLLNGMQLFDTTNYTVVFISDHFRVEETNDFLNDIKKLKKTHQTVFLLMMEATPTEMDQGLAARRGFAKAISLSASQADIDNLKIALAFEEGQKEIKQRVVEVNAALKLLAKEIDRVGQDRKRGKNTPFKKITSDFIEVQTQFAQEIMDNYYESLLKYSQDISPDALSEISEIDTPETALARNLPNLSKDKYSGVSHRVWTRLRKRHGKKIDAPSQAGGSAGLPELPELPESQEPDANPDDTDGSKK